MSAGGPQSAVWSLSALPSAPLLPCSLPWLQSFPPATPGFCQWRGFLVCGNFSSFTAPSQRVRSHPYSFVSVFSFLFFPTQVRGEFLDFWEVWGLLPVFSRCSAGVVPHVDVFLMYLWGGRWSPCLTLLPTWRSPPIILLLNLNSETDKAQNLAMSLSPRRNKTSPWIFLLDTFFALLPWDFPSGEVLL